MLRRRAAVAARAAKDDVVRADLVLEPAAEPVERPLERGVGEGLDLAAVVADEVMMVLAACESRLIPGHSAEVDALDEALLPEQVERSVDGRDSDGPIFGTQGVEDFLCA
jgi:hypothetical protein